LNLKEALKTIDNIALAISNEQEKLEKYKIEMQSVSQQFIKATGTFFVIWYNSTARNYVIKDSQNTLSLGKDRLKQLKSKLKDLNDNAEKFTNNFLSANSLWWHLSPKDGDNNVSVYSQIGSKVPEIIDQPIRKGLGILGGLLEEFGYNVVSKAGSYDDEVSVWNNKNISPYPTNPVPYYPDSLDWSSDMKDLMKKYSEIYKQAHDAYSNIKRLQQSKVDKQAANLWDSL
jgi:hypothetical protein